MTDLEALTRLIVPELKSLGYDLVRVAFVGGKSDPTLQIMAERPDTRQLTLGDCETISRRLSDVLDSADPIEASYRLEVSSPGIDRPLTRAKDYAAWAGHEAKISLAKDTEGQRNFRGKLVGIDGDQVTIEDRSAGEVTLPLDRIHSAKLVLTDALIAATRPIDTTGADEILETEEE